MIDPSTKHAPAAAASGAVHTGGAEATPLHLGGTSAIHAASGGSGIMRTIVALIVVAAVIYAVAWILRRVKGGAVRAQGSSLRQLATLPLGSGRSLTLVRAGREVVLLGVAEHGVTPIRTYTADELAELGLDSEPPVAPTTGSGAAALPATAAARRVESLLERLRQLTVRS